MNELLRALAPGGGPLAVFAAHPDDETIGAGALLARAENVRVVHVTDGAPREPRFWTDSGAQSREEYARIRRDEAAAALARAGHPASALRSLGFVDQETWLRLTDVTLTVEALLLELRPAYVLTHPYEGGHPDHDSTAFAVWMAVHRLARSGVDAPPVFEFTSYHRRGRAVVFGRFRSEAGTGEVTIRLSPEERLRKADMLDCFASQARVVASVPLDVERFRRAPAYTFIAPPHPGPLNYEAFRWAPNGAAWRRAAECARRRLAGRCAPYAPRA